MKQNIGKMYAGLTDDPERRRLEHGSPADWKIEKFATETDAHAWELTMTLNLGYAGGPGGAGWKYGYTYTITERTIEN